MTEDPILDLPMRDNDSGQTTIRGYLKALLKTLWAEGEGFSGKRPFGNSGWEWDMLQPLAAGGLIKAKLDPDGYWIDMPDEERKKGEAIIAEAIERL